MWELHITTQFKKDLKKYRNRPDKVANLKSVLAFLQESGTVPKQYRPHMLSGDYSGYMECHVESDQLLIWIDESEQVISLVRFGTHSELFR